MQHEYKQTDSRRNRRDRSVGQPDQTGKAGPLGQCVV
nr:MAG TPA: hypothetical protein [Caudoviricetes sp.]